MRLMWLSSIRFQRWFNLAATRAAGHGRRQWVPPHFWSLPPFGRPCVPVTVCRTGGGGELRRVGVVLKG